MLYRILEIFPGFLTWATFIAMFILSYFYPFAISVFFVLYTLFWLLRIIYLHFHLKHSFDFMRKNMEINWLEKLKELKTQNSWNEIYHLMVLPMYKEPLIVVEETFKKLVEMNYPKDKIIVVFAIEERVREYAMEIAKDIEKKYANHFFKFLITVHPDNLPGEIPGKGSNETWAVREAKEKIIDSLEIPYEKIIVSVFDVDTQAMPEYFARLTYIFLTCENPQHSSFQPIPLFLNNIFEAPAFSRVMSFFPTFWQFIQQSRVEQLSTFTSQAMPFKALVEVGFWDTHSVSEDSLIFWKFYFHYNGNWRTEPLHYPVSMDANAASSLWKTFVNIYKQQKRWAWGVENIPYMLNGFIKNKKIPFSKKFFWSFVFIEGFWSWTTSPFILLILGWLPSLIGGYDYNTSLLAYNLPKVTSPIINLTLAGMIASSVLSASLLPPKPIWFKRKHYIFYFIQWLLVPFVIIFFSAVPAVESQTRLMLGGKFRLGFWPTPKIRKV